jgi:hypothetical protein
MSELLFSGRSIWTMVHGVLLGGTALVALGAALYGLYGMRAAGAETGTERQARSLGWMTAFAAVTLWLGVFVGTYVSFPSYRATPPEGVEDLASYPRALLLSDFGAAWLHAFAMEIKEHVPWIAAMLATSVAFVAIRYRGRLLSDPRLNRMASMLMAIAFALAGVVGLLGILINKVAPLE